MKPAEDAVRVEVAGDPGTVPEAPPVEAQTAVTPSEGPASPVQVCYTAELLTGCTHGRSAAAVSTHECHCLMACGAQVAAFVKHPALIVNRNIEW